MRTFLLSRMNFPKRQILLLHLFGWLFFLSLPLLFIAAQSSYSLASLYLLPLFWLYFSIYPVFFYLHTYFLFPKLYVVKKYGLYGGSVLLMAATVFWLRPFDRTITDIHAPMSQAQLQGRDSQRQFPDGPQPGQRPPGPPPNENAPPPYPEMAANPFEQQPRGPQLQPPSENGGRPILDIISILLFVLTIGFSITLQAILRWRTAIRLAAQAETDKVNAELSFLKAQINPHFLFNTLNNIYALAVVKDDNTADSIMKLSNIMRYVTDEATGNFVALQSEADCIADYIDLQRLRVSKKTEIVYEITGSLDTKSIAPLILMTFVENVFKYGISSHEKSAVIIRLAAEDTGITFFCENPVFPSNHIKESTGIGIANTKKRLTFLYPGKHLLTIDTAENKFTVTLTLRTAYTG